LENTSIAAKDWTA